MKKIATLLFLLIGWQSIVAQTCTNAYKIVVLGSSTAAGNGTTTLDSAWVYRYKAYLQSINANYEIIDLAIAGYTTYEIQSSDFVPPAGRPSPHPTHNITEAISLHPDAIIINLPSNDAADNYTITEQEDNFIRVTDTAAAHNIPVWVTTTQPRDNFDVSQVYSLDTIRNWIYSYYGAKAIDFWTDLATAKDSIVETYSYGDGIHLDDAGHRILFERVQAANITDSLCLRDQVLPLTWISFYGFNENGANVLDWEVTTQLNAGNFVIQKSKNGVQWNDIAVVNSLSVKYQLQQDYTFSDNDPQTGVNYYRLKINNKDGNIQYSKIITLNAPSENNIGIFPNPVSGDMLYLKKVYQRIQGVKIINMKGQIIYDDPAFTGDNISVASLPAGLYMLIIDSPNKRIPFVKQ